MMDATDRLLLSQEEESSIETEVAIANDEAIHPYHQDVIDHPEKYVVILRDQYNQLVEQAAVARTLGSRISNLFWKWFPLYTFVSYEQALSIFERDLRPVSDDQWKEEVKTAASGTKTYPCRHPHCTVKPFANASNRNRHERNTHGDIGTKENGHDEMGDKHD